MEIKVFKDTKPIQISENEEKFRKYFSNYIMKLYENFLVEELKAETLEKEGKTLKFLAMKMSIENNLYDMGKVEKYLESEGVKHEVFDSIFEQVKNMYLEAHKNKRSAGEPGEG